MDVPSSPKSHDHEVGFSVERSVKLTGSGAVPEAGVPVKSAAGGFPPPSGSTVMLSVTSNLFLALSSIFPFHCQSVSSEGRSVRSNAAV